MRSEAKLKLNGLNHLRAFAILFVLLSHLPLKNLPNWLITFVNLGWSGVDLFFVLSGFLISQQLFNTIGTKNWIARFFIKRSLRIFPAYFFVVAVYFIFPFFREGQQLPPLWKFLTFTQNIAPDPALQGAFFHAWSLCIEEQFYLFLPAVLFLLYRLKIMKFGWIIILVLLILTCFIRYYAWQNYVAPLQLQNASGGDLSWLQWIYCPAWTRLDGFLTGISIAAVYKYFPALSSKILKYGNGLLVTGLIILLIAFLLCIKRISFAANIFGLPVLAIAYGFLLMAALSPSCILYKVKLRLTSFIAAAAYCIYLVHRSIIYICEEQLHNAAITNSIVISVVSIIAVIAAAMLLRYVIEIPGLKLRDKLIKKYYS